MDITGFELLQVSVFWLGCGTANILIGYALQPKGITVPKSVASKAHFLMTASGPIGLIYTLHIVARFYSRKWKANRS